MPNQKVVVLLQHEFNHNFWYVSLVVYDINNNKNNNNNNNNNNVWDVTVPDTYAASHLNHTSCVAGAAAETAAINKNIKYNSFTTTHHFVPIAIETGGAWCTAAIEFIQALGHKITEVTEDPMETAFLFQRISIAIQRGNSLSFHNAFLPNSNNNFLPTEP